ILRTVAGVPRTVQIDTVARTTAGPGSVYPGGTFSFPASVAVGDVYRWTCHFSWTRIANSAVNLNLALLYQAAFGVSLSFAPPAAAGTFHGRLEALVRVVQLPPSGLATVTLIVDIDGVGTKGGSNPSMTFDVTPWTVNLFMSLSNI